MTFVKIQFGTPLAPPLHSALAYLGPKAVRPPWLGDSNKIPQAFLDLRIGYAFRPT